MTHATVALLRCDSYEEQQVYHCVKKGVELLGGAGAFCRPGEAIILKPNVVAPKPVVCTHPAVVYAVGRVFKEAGANLFYGDSTGIGKTSLLMKAAGYAPYAQKLDMQCADFDKGRQTSFKDGVRVKNFTIAEAVFDAQGMISIAKVKTHGLTRITGAVKNQLGCLPGGLKGQMHARYPNVADFSQMLVDLTRCIKPRLYVADGIVAMERNGPQSGDPFALNVLLFSADPVALDTAICKLIDLDPAFVPTITAGVQAGLGISDWPSITIVGDDLTRLRRPEFKIPRRPAASPSANKLIGWIKVVSCDRPVIDNHACTRCGSCIAACPLTPKALAWPDEKKDAQGRRKNIPRYNYQTCIRCFCCHEFCPHRAITIKKPFVGKMLPLFSYLALFISTLRRPAAH